MIALDLDGTLAVDNHQVSPATRDALAALHADGVEVVIATGRRYRTTRFVMDNLGLDTFAVCNGGALVKSPEQATLHSELMDIANVASLARAHGLPIFAQRDAHDHGGADFVIDNVPVWNEHMHTHHRNNEAWCIATDILEHEPGFMTCGTFGDEDILNAFSEAMQAEHPGAYNVIIVPHLQTETFYCEISSSHVDKWHGLSRLGAHLDIDAEAICAVGDQLNDLPMIIRAGHGFAMENGHEELKKAATRTCGHNQQDGIVQVVDYIREFNARYA